MKNSYLTFLSRCFFRSALLVVFCFMLIFASLSSLYCDVEFDDLAGSVSTFWNDSNGLPSNTLLDIVQDDVGYIWLASYDGLIRFDGLSFTEFSKKETGFTGASPRVLQKGTDGSLWIGTNTSGLYNYKNKKFVHYGQDSGLPDLSVRAMNIDDNNRLYVGTAGGIAYLGDEGQLIKFPDEVNAEVGVVSFILPYKDRLFVGSNKKGMRVIKDGKIATPDYLKEIESETFSAGYVDFDDSIWLGTISGKMFQIKNDEIVQRCEFENMSSATINKFMRFKNGIMYVASYKGLGRFNKNGFDLFSEKKGLPDKLVSSLCQDNEGNLWIAMKHAGVGKFSKGKFLDVTRSAYLPQESIHSVLEDSDGNIWSTSDNGVKCLKNSSISSARGEIIDALVARLKGVRVRQVREEGDGTLFFATYSNDALLICHPDGSIKVLNEHNGLASNKVRFSYRDETGVLWIGTTAGASYYIDGKMGRVPDSELPNTFILSIFRDHKGSLWVGTDGGGVAKFRVAESEDGEIKLTLENIFNNENGLAGNIIFRITEDAKDNLWFSTSTGLTLYTGSAFYSASNALGTENEQIFNFIPDKQGNVWIIEPKQLHFTQLDVFTQAVKDDVPVENMKRYNKLDGIAGQLVANSWPHLTKSNRLFLPTSKGVSLCDSYDDVSARFSPPVVIENVVVDNRRFEAVREKFKVPASAKRISFKFTALSYTVPERVRFEYMLEGYDNHWLSSGSHREIGYTNLGPGNYVFKVRATNNEVFLNNDSCNISFYKEPFFYQKTWFYIVVPLLVASLIVLLVQLKLNSLKAKARELDSLVQEKTKELALEKEKSDNLLASILPAPIIEELIATGKSKPRLYSSVSILFADLVGFTKWAGDNPSEEVIAKLNHIFSHFDEIMVRHGCERIKTLGDGYLACCGLRGEASHAEKLVDAAIEMLKTLEKANEVAGSAFKIKIAIDSGAVTGGIVGEDKYLFDLFGDTVNTTFRLQAVTSPMACTISSKTASLLNGKYPLYKRQTRELKGKGKCESYYLIYKDKSIKDKVNLASSWKALGVAFNEKDFQRCNDIIKQMDVSLLEPEIAEKLEIVKKMIAKNSLS